MNDVEAHLKRRYEEFRVQLIYEQESLMRVRFTEENNGEEPTDEDVSRRGAIYIRSMPEICYPPKDVPGSSLEFGFVKPDPYTYPEPRRFQRYLREIYWKDKLVGTIHIELNATEAKYSIAVRYVY